MIELPTYGDGGGCRSCDCHGKPMSPPRRVDCCCGVSATMELPAKISSSRRRRRVRIAGFGFLAGVSSMIDRTGVSSTANIEAREERDVLLTGLGLLKGVSSGGEDGIRLSALPSRAFGLF